MRFLARLKQRFVAELPLWRLSTWQLLLLGAWAGWPWVALGWLPEDSFWPQLPILVFLPVTYLSGALCELLFPNLPHAHTWGVSVTVFALAYLGIVSWRQRRKLRS